MFDLEEEDLEGAGEMMQRLDAKLVECSNMPPENPIPETPTTFDPLVKFPWIFLMREESVRRLRWLQEQGIDPIEYMSAALEERFEKDERFKT